MLIDTISEAFSGDKELFNGLWIYGSDYSFEKHPVLRLDLSNIANDTPDILKEGLTTTCWT
ncbi:MAG: AAA family ATPase [Clostridiales bacterium]|nr:AAA family ATPase [Clostridiales bacterium]